MKVTEAVVLGDSVDVEVWDWDRKVALKVPVVVGAGEKVREGRGLRDSEPEAE